LNRQAWVRTLLASAAIASAVALSGCETDGTSPVVTARAMAPLSNEMLSLLEQKNMPKESPILVRIFKEEAELEVWKQDASGQYALLKTYPICRWSGELGPKVKQGDRQAPEGFYQITPGQMNPNSAWYLSFNIGFPNAYDRANDRTGQFLMVHGDCSSAGCYAMTDEQMGEIYALGREAFFGGQKSFQVQAYPFHMTALNMARHRNSPNMAFWRMIKEGNDIFETTRQEPKVDVCEKRYVFNAETNGRFDSRGRCPAYKMSDQVAAALGEKKERDEREYAALVARNTPTIPAKTGVDGGMNRVFLAKLRSQDRFDEGGRIFSLASTQHVPDMGNNVNPPKPAPETDTTSSLPAPQPTRVASADSAPPSRSLASSSDAPSAFSRVGKWFGFGGDDSPPPPAQPAAPAAKPKAEARHAPASRATPPARTQVAEEKKPAPTAAAAPAPAAAPALIAGAQPVVSSNSFENRWGGMR
jgi:murein L,D-transpeptidase YafK